jgi:hypothetical protein
MTSPSPKTWAFAAGTQILQNGKLALPVNESSASSRRVAGEIALPQPVL